MWQIAVLKLVKKGQKIADAKTANGLWRLKPMSTKNLDIVDEESPVEVSKDREAYDELQADIVGVALSLDGTTVVLTLYSDKVKIKTNIYLDEDGVGNLARMFGGFIPSPLVGYE